MKKFKEVKKLWWYDDMHKENENLQTINQDPKKI